MNQKLLISLAVLAVLITALFYFTGKNRTDDIRENSANTPSDIQAPVLPETMEEENATVEAVVDGLNIPWEFVFLPDQSLLVTERPGHLARIMPDGEKINIPVDGVTHVGEGGLLGLALDPDYSDNGYIYLYYTTGGAANPKNKVERYAFNEAGNSLAEPRSIIEDIPGGLNHNGGRIAFGPDGLLYVSTGDAGQGRLAQNTGNLAGKILRLHPDGRVPDDNPFGNAVYSYGHRNPQGLAWDSQGRLWITEHGPSGALSGFDEINLVEAGGNYGWPDVYGDTEKSGAIAPVRHSGADDTWAPGGLELIGDRLVFAGLRGQALYTAEIKNSRLEDLDAYFKNEYGRLRAVKYYEGWLYFATSNTDGRGQPGPGDDRILRTRLEVLK